MKNLILIFLSLMFFTGCTNSQAQQKPAVENIDAATFRKLTGSGKGIILDVRTPGEVAEGRIANAVHYNFYDEDFQARIKTLDRNKEVYVYCAGGGRSSNAAELLRNNGFSKVYNLKDGFDDWKKKGYPVAKN